MMSSDMKYLEWCMKIERGLRLITPSRKISDSYIKKANTKLRSMNLLFENDFLEDAINNAYYAMYYAIYSLLIHCGVKSENHSCSIAVFKFLFVDEELVDSNRMKHIRFDKKERIDKQYYLPKEIDVDMTKRLMEMAHDFVLDMEIIRTQMNQDQINRLKRKIESVM